MSVGVHDYLVMRNFFLFYIWIITVATSEINHTSVIINGTVKLECPFNLTEDSKISWIQKSTYTDIGRCNNNGMEYLNPKLPEFNVKIIKSNRCVLEIKKLAVNDEANYTCIGKINKIPVNYTFIITSVLKETYNTDVQSETKATRDCKKTSEVEMLCMFNESNIYKGQHNVPFNFEEDYEQTVQVFDCRRTTTNICKTLQSTFQVYIIDMLDKIKDKPKSGGIEINCAGVMHTNISYNNSVMTKCENQKLLVGTYRNNTLKMSTSGCTEDSCNHIECNVFQCEVPLKMKDSFIGFPLEYISMTAMAISIGITMLGLLTFLVISKVTRAGYKNNSFDKVNNKEHCRNARKEKTVDRSFVSRQTGKNIKQPISYVVRNETHLNNETNADDKGGSNNYQLDTQKTVSRSNPTNSVLNYCEVVFDTKVPTAKFYIKGKEETTPYADIDLKLKAEPLSESDQSSESDNDEFMSLGGIQEMMNKDSTIQDEL